MAQGAHDIDAVHACMTRRRLRDGAAEDAGTESAHALCALGRAWPLRPRARQLWAVTPSASAIQQRNVFRRERHHPKALRNIHRAVLC